MNQRSRALFAATCGALVAVLTQYVHLVVFEHVATCCVNDSRATPLWFTLTSTPLQALVPLAPGFIAGWIGRQRGILLGFLAGLVGNIVYSAAFGTFWGSTFEGGISEVALVVGWLLLGAVGWALYSAAAGGTAQLLRSNYALERTRGG